MWPFIKKAKKPEAKIVEEKPKPEPHPEVKPEPPLMVKLECPTCKQSLERHSRNRFKCPHCRNWIYFLGNRPVTREDHERLREKYYQDRHEECLKQSMAEDLAKLGLNEEMIQQREQDFVRKTGVSPKKFTVVLSLFNETILKLKDLNEMEERYHNLAIILNKGGEESFHILKAAAKTKLAALKKEGFKNVYILTSQMCAACKQVDGEVLSIEEALRTMPIPIKECTNYPYNENRSFCICSYNPEYDDEYWAKQK